MTGVRLVRILIFCQKPTLLVGFFRIVRLANFLEDYKKLK